MLSDMSLFQIYGAMARHAAESQKTSAGNLARANEPGYKAVAVESFADFVARTNNAGGGLDFSQPFEQRLTTGRGGAKRQHSEHRAGSVQIGRGGWQAHDGAECIHQVHGLNEARDWATIIGA